MSNQAAIAILQDIREYVRQHPKPVAEIPSPFTGEPLTVTVEDVDEDGRAYCKNPAGNAEYPFVDTLMNLRPAVVVDVAGLVSRDISRKVMST